MSAAATSSTRLADERAAEARVFVAMPIYALGKASGPAERSPSLEDMRRTVGQWLAGEPAEVPPPRGIVTAATVMRRLSALGREGVLDVVPCCTLLALARSVQATRFLASGCGWMLFIDDDISAAPDTVLEMLAADADCILATYAQRLPPHRLTVHLVEGRDPRQAPMRRTPSGARVIEVASGGLGLALLRRRVVEAVAAAHPELSFDDGGQRHVKIFEEQILDLAGQRRSVGEDVAFFARVRAAGFKVECLADATINHDGTMANLGEFLDSNAPLVTDDEPEGGGSHGDA